LEPLQPAGARARWYRDLNHVEGDGLTNEALPDIEPGAGGAGKGDDDDPLDLAAYAAFFDQAPVAMVTVRPDRTIRLNRAAELLYGRTSVEMQALAFQPNSPWIPDDQRHIWEDMRRRVAAGERMEGVRHAYIRPGGERREAETSSIPIRLEDGSPAGVITVITDLTDRLSVEAQLRHAQKMEALGRLAGGIAHDFNNVLMGILGYAEIVAADARESKVEVRDAEQVLVATRRAIDLARRLTAFARREAARTEIIDVGEMVENIVPLLKRLAPESIGIDTKLAPNQFVRADRSELEQALVNLAVNAIDAMPRGGRLTVDVEPVELDADHAATHVGESPGPHVMIAVSDTGQGMDESTKARIFEPFYTTKPVGEGTGLGLAMVFGAVERARGRVWVYSELGRGTTFKIYLPLGGEAPASDEPGADELVPTGTESILVLEDDELVRDVVERTLRRLGYEVTAASRPSEAIALARDQAFDLLVTDVVMPEMTGDALAREIRSERPDLPVVFMSGYTAGVLDLDIGPLDVFASKPLTAGRIARAVRDALDPRKRTGTR
jgi:two-component system cell cycle sensor histidine kinase/response regulator CckA